MHETPTSIAGRRPDGTLVQAWPDRDSAGGWRVGYWQPGRAGGTADCYTTVPDRTAARRLVATQTERN